MKIKYLLLTLIGFCVNIYAKAQPKLIVHLDVNRTIIAQDPAGGKDLKEGLMGAFAEQYVYRWDDSLEHPISYEDYVKNHVLPGAKSDRALKEKRNKMIAGFIDYLSSVAHPLCGAIREHFNRVYNKLASREQIIFPSVYRGIAYLKQNNIEHSVVLRTFGSDLDRIIEEIHTYISPTFFTWKGTFKNGVLTMRQIRGQEVIVLHTPTQVYQFLKEHGNVAIQDDWPYWNSHGEIQEYGKLFPIDVNDDTAVSLFADDNASPEDGILNARCAKTNAVLNTQELINAGYVRIADTIAAIEDDEYFVSYFRMMLGNGS